MRGLIALAFVMCLVLGKPPISVHAEATLTITPPSGPYGTLFEQRATGLPPGIGVVSVVRDPTGTEHPGPGLGAVPTNGEWRVGTSDAWRAERGEPLGEYTVMVKTIDGTTTLATATFSVTDPATQATVPTTLPRAGDVSMQTPLYASLGIFLVVFGSVLLRRGCPAPTR